MKFLLSIKFFFLVSVIYSQSKVSGIIVDENNKPLSYASISFSNSYKGTISNEDGSFYLESNITQKKLVINYLGFKAKEVLLDKKINYKLSIVLHEKNESLDKITVYGGKQSKNNNPAIDLLLKVIEKNNKNNILKVNQYKYDKYEKIEFQLNNIDSSFMKKKAFKNLEFIFMDIDTSKYTGINYLPFFVNESISEIYGDNTNNSYKKVILGSKNSGFNSNQAIIAYTEDLKINYSIYDNYIKLFEKSFTSPISKPGINSYNYVLFDSTYIDNRWSYNIIYYPRRKNELTFKGDFWVTDTTYAVKKINLEATKSANINWLKQIYIEQEYKEYLDGLYLINKDYLLADISYSKKYDKKGIYAKRTTLFDKYIFNEFKPNHFYQESKNKYNAEIFNKNDIFWKERRLESLNDDERGIYKLIDTLKTIKKFNRFYDIVSILGSGYIEIDKWNIDLGPIYNIFGYNEVEGNRYKFGGRTFFDQNDLWRLKGYLAYGERDKRIKYGFSASFLIDQNNRFIISSSHKNDISQLGMNLNALDYDILNTGIASSSIITKGINNLLTNIRSTSLDFEIEPVINFKIKLKNRFSKFNSAVEDQPFFSYYDSSTSTGISNEINQFSIQTIFSYTPGKEVVGNGVDRYLVDDDYSTIIFKYTKGLKGVFNSDFNYDKIQFSYIKPWYIGSIGKLKTSLDIGKTIGTVPVGLLHIIPGNQTIYSLYGTFHNLNYYEFITDTYAALHLEHNFNGRIFSRIPLLRKFNLREIIGVRGVWGEISDKNKQLSTPSELFLIAPNNKVYWEYSFGISNIFKILRIDFNFRGNYLENHNSRNFNVTGTFGFSF